MRNPPNPQLIFLVLCVASIHSAYGQMEPEAVCLKKHTDVSMEIENGVLTILEHHVLEKAFYKNFEKHAHESVYYSDFDPLLDIKAETLVPHKNKHKSVKVETFETKDIVQPGIFYGGYKRKDFVFPALQAGTIGKLSYTKRVIDPHLLTTFYFNDELVMIEESSFTVTAAVGIEINYKVFGDDKNQVAFGKQTVGNKTVYTWTCKKIKPFLKDKNAPGQPYSAPHVIVFIQSYNKGGKKEAVLSSVSDLYAWHNTLINAMQKNNDDYISDVVKGIVTPAMTQEEKVRTIFHWVQSNISYVAFENGMAGFVPRSASDVCNKKYGDCKDMANLLKSMLKAAGIEAYHTWIGTRKKPYSYHEVPSAASSNHMICAVNLNNEFIFLDATNSYNAFGKPSSMIQGKEALVGIDATNFKVLKVPVVPRQDNQRIDSVVVSLTDTGVRGTLSSLFTGYKKEDVEYKQLRYQMDKNDDFLEELLEIGNNNISIDQAEKHGLGVFDKPARIKASFLLPDYQKAIGDRIYVNLNLNKKLPGDFIEDLSREQALEEDYKYEYRSVITLQIPAGCSVSSLPKDTNKTWDHFGISTQYRHLGNTIVLEKIFYSDFLYLAPAQFTTWNDMLKAVESINQQTVILSKAK